MGFLLTWHEIKRDQIAQETEIAGYIPDGKVGFFENGKIHQLCKLFALLMRVALFYKNRRKQSDSEGDES